MKDIAAACGIAVSQDCPDATSDYWYQGDDFRVSGSGKNVTITWTVPESIREYVQENSYGKVNLGIWYAGEGVDEVYLDSAYIVYTSSAEETTTTAVTTTPATTTTTTASVTTTTPATTTTAVTTTKADATTTTTTTASDSSSDDSRVWGDINVDGTVNAVDVLMLKKYLLQMLEDSDIPDGGLLNADVTHDSNVSAPDLVLVKKYVLQMIDSLG
jgi:cytoskeletal protein RodZ